jgi:hypothetical protein
VSNTSICSPARRGSGRGRAQLAAIGRIENVALVIVPESLAGAYAAIPSSHVAATIYVPDGVNVRVHTGALVVGGARMVASTRPVRPAA